MGIPVLPERYENPFVTSFVKMVAVTPDNDVEIDRTLCLRIGGGGNVAVEFPDGTSFTVVGLQAGEYLYVNAVKVLATGTTATGIAACY
jgi:hypothetical protein